MSNFNEQCLPLHFGHIVWVKSKLLKILRCRGWFFVNKNSNKISSLKEFKIIFPHYEQIYASYKLLKNNKTNRTKMILPTVLLVLMILLWIFYKSFNVQTKFLSIWLSYIIRINDKFLARKYECKNGLNIGFNKINN